MNRNDDRIAHCKAQRLEAQGAAALYATHAGYTHALQTLLECMRARIEGSDEKLHGSTPHEIRYRLIGMVAHARDRADCVRCTRGLSDLERLVLAFLPDYLRSTHAAGQDGYAKITVDLPPVSDASDGEESGPVMLLDAWEFFLRGETPAPRRANRHRAPHLVAVS